MSSCSQRNINFMMHLTKTVCRTDGMLYALQHEFFFTESEYIHPILTAALRVLSKFIKKSQNKLSPQSLMHTDVRVEIRQLFSKYSIKNLQACCTRRWICQEIKEILQGHLLYFCFTICRESFNQNHFLMLLSFNPSCTML